MINSTYAPKRYEDLNSDSCTVDNQTIQDVADAGTSTNIDLKLTDDHLITGIQLIVENANFGDTVTMQVVDNDGVLPTVYGPYWTAEQPVLYPNYPVLRQFATNWGLSSDVQVKFDEGQLYPAKIIAGLYIRIIYTSTGTSNVNVIANYRLHMVLT